MIDTHAHIHDALFDKDRREVIVRAQKAGITKMITIGTSVRESREALLLAKEYADILYATAAVHPCEYSKLPSLELQQQWMREVEIMAQEKEVKGIGECGLDYHTFENIEISAEQKQSQRKGFLQHIRLAEKVKKPLIIHARDSYEDVFEMVSLYGKNIPHILLHCYQGDREITKKYIQSSLPIFFSFSGSITYPVKKSIEKTKDDPREVMREIPLEKILLETDCPYLSPQSQRGKRNEPMFIFETVTFLAEQKKISLGKLEDILEYNFSSLFGK
ncbi:MAG: TatD family deoxyribonuclease [Candidatus Moranbacteria bacterium]|nr:TatD family deoxyribonuclease [Candidatus Moranbacteria bacterium]